MEADYLQDHRLKMTDIINGKLADDENGISTPEIKIDLYNFEDPEYEDSKYVLTSPRSLEACAKLGVKPVDLLYKPLSEFQEELLPQDIPLRTIYNIYDEHEITRQRKLKQCRDERNKLCKEAASCKKGSKARQRPVSSVGVSPKRTSRSRLYRSMSDEDIRAQGSLQRQRTAWTTSVGHKRVTPENINRRVQQLHEESVKLRNELLSRKERRPRTPKMNKSKPVSRSRSASSLAMSNSVCSLNRSKREARPIASPALQKTLSSSSLNLKSLYVTPRDERILELMASKGESEKAAYRDSYMADLAWDEQRRKEEEAKIRSEQKRRDLLAEENKLKKERQMAKSKIQSNLEEELLEEHQHYLESKQRKWDRMYKAQQKMKDLKLAEQKEREQLRRTSQSRNKRLIEEDEQEMQELVLRQQEQDLLTASQRKEGRMLQETKEKIMERRRERMAFELKKHELEESTKLEENQLRRSIDKKHAKANRNYRIVNKNKENRVHLNQIERQKKALSAKISQKQLEEELEEWRHDVVDHRKVAEEHAAEVTEREKFERARKAHEERLLKEQLQKQNLTKLKKEEAKKIRQTKAIIKRKEQITEAVMHDKNATIQQSRDVAHSSEKLRQELREKYGAETFDKKLFRVELFHQIGLGHLPPKGKV